VVNSFYHLAGRTSLPFGSYHFSAYTCERKMANLLKDKLFLKMPLPML
jgi:hypothetical protein